MANHNMGTQTTKAVGWRKCANELPPIGEAVIVRWPDGDSQIMWLEEAPEDPGTRRWCWLPGCPICDVVDGDEPPIEWNYLPR